ncbi:MAG: type III-B CRISPR module-associated protein Cmr5 [Marinosulfonomonas sp.]|nr:type III-B CRISPR module-associated protein Cmr5 [Marinosulfonomonas sp.]
MTRRRHARKNTNKRNAPTQNTQAQSQNSARPVETDQSTVTNNTRQVTKKSQAQERAVHALEKITTLAALPVSDRGKYVSYVKALPANIFMSGLGQAMAMEKASHKYEGHAHLFSHVQSWLCNGGGNGWKSSPYRTNTDLLRAICGGSQDDYIRAQAEALEYLNWLKKFAVAYLTETTEPKSSDEHAAATT